MGPARRQHCIPTSLDINAVVRSRLRALGRVKRVQKDTNKLHFYIVKMSLDSVLTT